MSRLFYFNQTNKLACPSGPQDSSHEVSNRGMEIFSGILGECLQDQLRIENQVLLLSSW
jgi:hypothetical protein